MFLPPYTLNDLAFAYRCYVYFRWHTYRNEPIGTLRFLTADHLQAIHPEIHVLELTTSETEIRLLARLLPTESPSTAASKLKGAASKTIRELQGLTAPAKLLGGGYFAATVGDNTSPELERYLDRQDEHHGYDQRANSPVWTQTWPSSESDHTALQPAHAVTILGWHLVISTWNRQGVFNRQAGQAICECWERSLADWRVCLRKVSVLPDHIHIAIRAHPAISPGKLALEMLNVSQELMRNSFEHLFVQAGIPRLWKPGAYAGSFGDITKDHVRNDLRQWVRGQLA